MRPAIIIGPVARSNRSGSVAAARPFRECRRPGWRSPISEEHATDAPALAKYRVVHPKESQRFQDKHAWFTSGRLEGATHVPILSGWSEHLCSRPVKWRRGLALREV